MIVDAVKVVVLDVPAKGGQGHAEVQPRHRDPGGGLHVLAAVPAVVRACGAGDREGAQAARSAVSRWCCEHVLIGRNHLSVAIPSATVVGILSRSSRRAARLRRQGRGGQ